MSGLMTDVVVPAFQALGLQCEVMDDGCGVLSVRRAPAGYDVCIREVAHPPLLWIRFTPHIWVDPSCSDMLVLLAALNHTRWFVKCGRAITDGEVVFDAEFPLYPGVTAEVLSGFLAHASATVTDILPRLLAVQWGSRSSADALHGQRPSPGAAPSRAVEEARSIVERLTASPEWKEDGPA